MQMKSLVSLISSDVYISFGCPKNVSLHKVLNILKILFNLHLIRVVSVLLW